MDGDIGFYTIKPDQMQVINPLLILTFIPLYELIFYPLLSLIGIRRPLQKLTLGGIFAGIAFVISAIVEINLEKTYAVLPQAGNAQVRFYNGRNCDYTIQTNIPNMERVELKFMEVYENIHVPIRDGQQNYTYSFSSTNCQEDRNTGLLILSQRTATSYFLNGTTSLSVDPFIDSPEKSRRGWPFVTVLANLQSSTARIRLVENGNERYNQLGTFSDQTDIHAGTYTVFVNDREIETGLELKLGGVYGIIISQTSGTAFRTNVVTITEPNSLNMLWLVPQYVIMTLGEVSGTFRKKNKTLSTFI